MAVTLKRRPSESESPEAFAGSEVVMITGHASLDTSIQALRLGATDYLVKPINFRHLKNILSRVTPPSEMQRRVATFEKDASEVGRFGPLARKTYCGYTPPRPDRAVRI